MLRCAITPPSPMARPPLPVGHPQRFYMELASAQSPGVTAVFMGDRITTRQQMEGQTVTVFGHFVCCWVCYSPPPWHARRNVGRSGPARMCCARTPLCPPAAVCWPHVHPTWGQVCALCSWCRAICPPPPVAPAHMRYWSRHAGQAGTPGGGAPGVLPDVCL